MKFIFSNGTIVSLENIRTVSITPSNEIWVTYRDRADSARVPTDDTATTLQEIAKILREEA